MEQLKGVFNPRRKQPQTAFNPSGGREKSGNPTVPNLPPETEYSGSSSQNPPPVSSFPDGVEVLYDCSEATIDICFVHGLTGNRVTTWTANGQSTPWPTTLLPPKLSKARILTYGYDAYIVRRSVASSNRLIDHAMNLLNDLTTDRACCNASTRPLIFVTHSLGGLVCKEAILLSRNNPEAHLRSIFDSTKGIAFVGTPHKGAWMAEWAKIPASALGFMKSINRPLLQILETDNQLLESIQERFWAMIRELREGGRSLEVTCFFEELPLPLVGQVVSKESATLEGYNSISIHANHSDMVKFGSAEDNGFRRLLGELMRWEEQVSNSYIYKMDDKDRQCLENLGVTDPRDDKKRIEETKGDLLRDSYQWILENVDFQRWYDDKQNRLLWVKGDPGKGKTILLCAIVNELKNSIGDADLLSFFFCQAADSRINNAAAVLRGLIYLLVEQRPSLVSHIRKKYSKQLFQDTNSWSALSEIFTNILEDPSLPSTYLIIDALDECTKDLEKLLEFIVLKSSAYSHVKWIVSSRNCRTVGEHLDTATRKISLCLELNEGSICPGNRSKDEMPQQSHVLVEEPRPTYQMSEERWPFDEERYIVFCLVNRLNTRIALIQVVVNDTCEIQLWDANSWKKLWWMSGKFDTSIPCQLISFSEKGEYLLIKDRTGKSIHVIDVVSCETYKTISFGINEGLYAMAFTENKRRVGLTIRRDKFPAERYPPELRSRLPSDEVDQYIDDIIQYNGLSGHSPTIFYGGNGSRLYFCLWKSWDEDNQVAVTGWNVETRAVECRITHPTNLQNSFHFSNDLRSVYGPATLVLDEFISICGFNKNGSMKALIFSVTSNGQTPNAMLPCVSNPHTREDGIIRISKGTLRLWNNRSEAYLGEIDFRSFEMRQIVIVVIREGCERLSCIFKNGKVVDFERVHSIKEKQATD